MTKKEYIEQQIQKLREAYMKKENAEKRPILELQAKCLKKALDMLQSPT